MPQTYWTAGLQDEVEKSISCRNRRRSSSSFRNRCYHRHGPRLRFEDVAVVSEIMGLCVQRRTGWRAEAQTEAKATRNRTEKCGSEQGSDLGCLAAAWRVWGRRLLDDVKPGQEKPKFGIKSNNNFRRALASFCIRFYDLFCFHSSVII